MVASILKGKNRLKKRVEIFVLDVMLYLTNTRLGEKNRFVPLDQNHVRMYVCGPTVYDRAHIGNARSVVVFDLLFRILQNLFTKVTYVRNVTDIDDKIIDSCQEKGCSFKDLTSQMTSFFHQDMAFLKAISPTCEPLATDHLLIMIKMIQDLLQKGHAYSCDGHILFDVDSYPSYGNNLSFKKNLLSGARVEVASYKKNPYDFVLWKPAGKGEIGWDSPFGKGRPGWHIECSAMSYCYLGVPFDIHGGGNDLMFPHHENEIAQTCCATSTSIMANVWVHNGHLSFNGQKMSKSLGNIQTVDALSKTWSSAVLRLALLSSHYHQPLNWTENLLQQSKKAIHKWIGIIEKERIIGYKKCPPSLLEALYDDMNTPKALFEIHQFANQYFKNPTSCLAQKIYDACFFMGIILEEKDRFDQGIKDLIEKRKQARIEKDFQSADRLRDELLKRGIKVEDSKTR